MTFILGHPVIKATRKPTYGFKAGVGESLFNAVSVL